MPVISPLNILDILWIGPCPKRDGELTLLTLPPQLTDWIFKHLVLFDAISLALSQYVGLNCLNSFPTTSLNLMDKADIWCVQPLLTQNISQYPAP